MILPVVTVNVNFRAAHPIVVETFYLKLAGGKLKGKASLFIYHISATGQLKVFHIKHISAQETNNKMISL